MKYRPGDRVQSHINLMSIPGICCDNCGDIPAGSTGTVTSVHRAWLSYGVVFDNDRHQLPCSMNQNEIEAAS